MALARPDEAISINYQRFQTFARALCHKALFANAPLREEEYAEANSLARKTLDIMRDEWGCVDKPEPAPASLEAFKVDPLAIWIEMNIGLDGGEALKRARPQTLSDAEMLLAKDTGRPNDVCRRALESRLIAMVDALHERFGHGCCAFINGDGRLDDLGREDGTRGARSWTREQAADAFNGGKVRFLVSTEAAGEGIDLQERCATLVHVDMPWNPMRLHQRVGRLSRYGQKRPVQVFILRNPDTVEARIWDLLNAKLNRIQVALDGAMDEREDISQLVVGMTGAAAIEAIFAEGQVRGAKGLAQWFDERSATIGGKDVVDGVRDMLGNVSRFDFNRVGRNLPQVDLPDLERFLKLELERQGRRAMNRDDGLEVRAPEDWSRSDYAINRKYNGLVFDRNAPVDVKKAPTRLIGVGHALFDRALHEAVRRDVFLAPCGRLEHPIMLAIISDEVTGHGQTVGQVVIGVTQDALGNVQILRDWELLQRLNVLTRADLTAQELQNNRPAMAELAKTFLSTAERDASKFAEGMIRPRVRGEMMLLPA